MQLTQRFQQEEATSQAWQTESTEGSGRDRPQAWPPATPPGLWRLQLSLLQVVLHHLALFYFISGFSPVVYYAGGWAAAWGRAACPLTPCTTTAGSLPQPAPVAAKRTSQNSVLEARAKQVYGRENRILFSQGYRFLVIVHKDQSQLKRQCSAAEERLQNWLRSASEPAPVPALHTPSTALLSAALFIEHKRL